MEKIITILLIVAGAFMINAQQKDIHHEYAYIKNVEVQNDQRFILVDYVRFLTGKEALKSAIAHGDADLETNDNGKEEWSLPNDFYIANDSKKIRQLKLGKNCIYHLITMKNNLPKPMEQPFSFFKNQFADKLFEISFDKNDMISRIEEVYLP